MMTAAAQITLDQYLHTSYRPDCEFLDGELVDRNVGMWNHARSLALLAGWCYRYEREWSCLGAISQRIFVSPTRVRVPDLVLVSTGRQPDILVDPPVLIIEVVSPEDTYADTQRRVTDYRTMGVSTIWIIDPETRTARVIRGDTWIAATRLEVPGTPIFVNIDALFASLDETAPTE